ncbi:type II secretion system protein [Halobacillus rhizosphaerae]|uniref:pilus assembly FimT family protein n=1 Tax=Halobacillus rhizosphaerae TaxID=3064889 RepID=UPI00398A7A4A
MNKLLNNKGVTLIELLTALALFGIVTAITVSVLAQSMHASGAVEDNVQLKQETNLLLTAIREKANQGPADICMNSPTELMINHENLLTFDNFLISKLYIENGKNTLDEPENCIKISAESPISVAITTSTKDSTPSQSYQISTIIPSQTAENLELAGGDSSGDNNDDNGLHIFTSSEEFDTVQESDGQPYTEVRPKPPNCSYSEASKFYRTTFANWGGVCDRADFDSSVLSIEGITVRNAYLSIGENFYNRSDTTIDNSRFSVAGNILFQGNFTTYGQKDQNTIEGYNIFFNQQTNLYNDFLILAKGSLRFDRSTSINSSGTINSEGYLFANDHFLIGNTTRLSIKKDAIFNKSLKAYSNAELTVSGNLLVKDSLVMENNSRITIGRNAVISSKATVNGASMIKAYGNITFEGPAYFQNQTVIASAGDIIFHNTVGWNDNENELICAKGKVVGKEHINGPHTIREGSECTLFN